MAAEATPNVNGGFDGQYNQPAELAASTPSQPGSATQVQPASTPPPPQQQQQQKADPQEIGWYFVEQYYTTLSKTPERIHLFYSKKSQLVTGVEAEKVVPAVGTRAISDKIKALDIQDCKVRVLNVDSQSSFDNIVVQVIGHMSNKSQPHHKFVQTFVLATQPNGYFVLNDIFRYLNDEEAEVVEDQAVQESVSAVEPVQAEQPIEVSAVEEVVTSERAAQAVDEKLQDNVEDSAANEEAEEVTNGLEEAATVESAPTEESESAIAESVTAPEVEQPLAPEATPVIEAISKSTTEAPPAKKTWASLVGNKAPAIPALPTTTAPSANVQSKNQRPVQSVQPAQAPKANTEASTAPVTAAASNTPPTTAAATQNNGWQTADHGKKSRAAPQAKTSDGIVHAYIKNVTEKVDARILREVLEKYGELKYFDVARARNCALVEFADPAGYTAAVAANPHDVGGESISVEERRPRPGQYGNNNANFARGGGNPGRGRGGLQGRTGSQGTFQKEGRGGFAQRGVKPGNVTPKGRGQAQAT